VQESKLGSEIPSSFVENELYTLLRRDRAAGGGGLLVYIKKVYKDSIVDEFKDEIYETIKFSINSKIKAKENIRLSQVTIHTFKCQTIIFLILNNL
jgi:hypothetical protein